MLLESGRMGGGGHRSLHMYESQKNPTEYGLGNGSDTRVLGWRDLLERTRGGKKV